MIVDDYGEMIVEDGSLLVLEAELVPILILELASLQISEHCGSWEIIRQPDTHSYYKTNNRARDCSGKKLMLKDFFTSITASNRRCHRLT